VSQAELVDWAERAMMDADFDEVPKFSQRLSADSASPTSQNSDFAGRIAKNSFVGLATVRK
jgi:hypothetical protein